VTWLRQPIACLVPVPRAIDIARYHAVSLIRDKKGSRRAPGVIDVLPKAAVTESDQREEAKRRSERRKQSAKSESNEVCHSHVNTLCVIDRKFQLTLFLACFASFAASLLRVNLKPAAATRAGTVIPAEALPETLPHTS
jgi:hypothetical protein